MPKYQGHKNWNHWNVSLWLHNDADLLSVMSQNVKKYGSTLAAPLTLISLKNRGLTHTPDGAPYSISSIRGAIRMLEA